MMYQVENRELFTDLWEHEKLLADRVRVRAYERALERYVDPGCTVLDVGTGTGILSFIASRFQPRTIYAVDHAPVIECARMVANANGIPGIEFHQCHSKDFTPEAPIDLIVHEQIGNLLFDERMVDTLVDLRTRVLAPNGRILPGKFELHVEPVELVDEFSVPFAYQQRTAGIDFSALAGEDADRRRTMLRWITPEQVHHRLCDADPLLVIDLNDPTTTSLPTVLRSQRRVAAPGRFDGYCVSFVARFDDELGFDSSPFASSDRRAWSWLNRLLRAETRDVRAGDEISLELRADDLADPATWSWMTQHRTG